MDEKWKIEYYKTKSDKSHVKEFLDNLETHTGAKVFATLDLLKEFGINLGMPHSKKVLGTSLWELRVLGNDNVRIFYIAKIGKTFLLLHGFLKKKQKTDKKEIKIASDRLAEYESRNKN